MTNSKPPPAVHGHRAAAKKILGMRAILAKVTVLQLDSATIDSRIC